MLCEERYNLMERKGKEGGERGGEGGREREKVGKKRNNNKMTSQH